MGVGMAMENDNKIKLFLERIFGKNKKMLSDNNEATNKNNKMKNRKIENLVVFIIIFSVTLIMVKYIFSGNSKNKENNKNLINNQNVELVYNDKVEVSDTSVSSSQYKLQNDLKDILRKIEGVRRCRRFNYIFRNKQSSSNL